MYILLFGLMFTCGAALAFIGARKRKNHFLVAGVTVCIFTFFFIWLLGFWAEMLWFEALGYIGRFWKVILTKTFAVATAAVVGLGIMFLLTLSGSRDGGSFRRWVCIAGGIAGGMWGYAHWETLLIFLYRVPTEVKDPILGMTTGFYLFTLPLLKALHGVFFQLAAIFLAARLMHVFVRFSGDREVRIDLSGKFRAGSGAYRSLYVGVALILYILAYGTFLDRYQLMYSTYGVATGPGWTDHNVKLQAFWLVIVLTIALGVCLLIPNIRDRLRKSAEGFGLAPALAHVAVLGGFAALLVVAWILFLRLVRLAFQKLLVQPNEITYEIPYIANNITFTRQGFRLDAIEERHFP